MSMKHFDGFDIYATVTNTDISADLRSNWHIVNATRSKIKIKPGRYEGYAIQFQSDVGGTGDPSLLQSVSVEMGQVAYIFLNYKFPNASAEDNDSYTYIRVYNGATFTELRITESQLLEVYYNNIGTGPEESYNLSADANWHSVLWQITRAADQNCRVYLDGVLIIDSIESITNFDELSIGGIDATTSSAHLDNLFLNTDAGDGFIERPHPGSRIKRLAPNADVAVTSPWIPSTGIDNYALIDDLPHNDNTDFIYTLDEGDDAICEFEAASPATGLEAVSVRLTGWWRNDATPDGAYSVVFLADDGVVIEVGTPTLADNSYTQKTEYFLDVHPATGSDWSTSTLDATDWGVRSAVTKSSTYLSLMGVPFGKYWQG